MNVSQFFREFLGRWNRENSRRSEDYILGGRVAIREISNALLTIKDVVSNDKVAAQLRASDKENREVQQRNRVLNEQIRQITEKFEKLSTAHELAKVDLMHLRQQQKPEPVSAYTGQTVGQMSLRLAAALGENSSLRNHVEELKGASKLNSRGLTMSEAGEVGSLRQRVKELEEQLGTFRVGGHRFDPQRFVRRLLKILNWDDTAALKLAHIERTALNAQSILNGEEPAEINA